MTDQKMTHREILEAMSGLLLAMFVAMLSSTIVSNALPTIVADLKGSQTGYTWVVVATMLAMTATTPIWGKLADLFSKKVLVQVALVIFSIGSIVAGAAPSMGVLIGARFIQGLGVGGLTALVQVVIASMVTPRERGRYSGYIGATFALATVSGPLIGGLLVDTVGWRWCFLAGLPVAVLAFVVLQKTLHLPVTKGEVSIDYLGSFLLVGGVSILLVWVSLGGQAGAGGFAWTSTASYLLVAAGVAVVAAAVYVEAKVAKEPVVPLRLFKDRTTSLATLASVLIGVAMFGATIYLSLYFQRARGMSPTEAGLMSTCMVLGLFVSSLFSGRIITRTGLWKRWLVGGMFTVVVGLALLGTIDATTPLWEVGTFMAILGLGLGATMQNLVLSVQNNVAQSDLGAASSVVTFFRSLGGSAGISALGAVLAHQVVSSVNAGMPAALQQLSQQTHVPVEVLKQKMAASSGDKLTSLDALPAPIRSLVEGAYGDATGHLFWVALPFAIAAFVSVLFIKEVPLRTTLLRSDELDPEVAAELGVDQALGGVKVRG